MTTSPFLALLPDNNPLHVPWRAAVALVVAALYLGFRLRQRRWLDAALAVSVLAGALVARQVMPWHSVIPLAVMVSFDPAESLRSRAGRYGFFITLAGLGMRTEWPYRWPTFL